MQKYLDMYYGASFVKGKTTKVNNNLLVTLVLETKAFNNNYKSLMLKI